jgi:hypothetical protein
VCHGHLWNDASDEFAGYYINLQAPLRRTPIGYDSFDHVLDIVVAPDRSWRWKDEDEFEEAIQLGLLTPNEAADIRAEGERVIADLPSLLPTGWENWRPDPHWLVSALRLPKDYWHHDPAAVYQKSRTPRRYAAQRVPGCTPSVCFPPATLRVDVPLNGLDLIRD